MHSCAFRSRTCFHKGGSHRRRTTPRSRRTSRTPERAFFLFRARLRFFPRAAGLRVFVGDDEVQPYASRNAAKHQNASLSSTTFSRNRAATSFMPWQYPTFGSRSAYATRARVKRARSARLATWGRFCFFGFGFGFTRSARLALGVALEAPVRLERAAGVNAVRGTSARITGTLSAYTERSRGRPRGRGGEGRTGGCRRRAGSRAFRAGVPGGRASPGTPDQGGRPGKKPPWTPASYPARPAERATRRTRGAAAAPALLLLHRRALGAADAQQQRPHLRSYVRRNPVARGAARARSRTCPPRRAPRGRSRRATRGRSGAGACAPATRPRTRPDRRADGATPPPRARRPPSERGDTEPEAGRRDDRGRRGALARRDRVVAAHARTRV